MNFQSGKFPNGFLHAQHLAKKSHEKFHTNEEKEKNKTKKSMKKNQTN